jgi:hypothetical protein
MMASTFVYDGHGHRIEVTPTWGGLGRVRFFLDGREVDPTRSWFKWRIEATTRDPGRAVAWAVEARSGNYGELQVRVWRDSALVTGWS